MGAAIIGAIGVVVAAVAAFWGVVQGARLTRENDNERWRRDQLLRGAASYISDSSERYDRYKVTNKEDMGDDERITLGNKEQYGRSLVSLVGSKALKDRLDELANLVSATSPASPLTHERDVLRALDVFVGQVREEIGSK